VRKAVLPGMEWMASIWRGSQSCQRQIIGAKTTPRGDDTSPRRGIDASSRAKGGFADVHPTKNSAALHEHHTVQQIFQ
jgi:hypothetical protein